jgi:methionyl-tRNA formyltransferase
MPLSVVVFADAEVGLHCTQWLLKSFRQDIKAVVTTSQNEICRLAKDNSVITHVFDDDTSYLRFCDNSEIKCDLGLLLWWPKIISPSIIGSTRLGFVNTHPSLLPFNRGKHYNFWALVEQCPFGVSLHLVDEGIDCGDLVAQKSIDYTWEDTGETLYAKAIAGMKELFVDTYPLLREERFATKAQDLSRGSIHFSTELESASRIALDEPTTARQLLNLLRARTFEGHPACSFWDNGVEYEARIKITKKK